MGKGLIVGAIFFCFSVPGEAVDVQTFIPAGAKVYAPTLAATQRLLWSDAPEPYTLGGLVEQESCVSLTGARCWNPRAELKTDREYGFGFGQITVTSRMNVFEELKRRHESLRGWGWDNRFDPKYQLTAIVEMTHLLWRRLSPNHIATNTDHWAFTLSSYNGGLGGLLQDRRLCSNTSGCDPSRWFGNVELTSAKSRTPQPSYAGQSWFEINRTHAKNIIKLRRDKYKPFWGLE